MTSLTTPLAGSPSLTWTGSILDFVFYYTWFFSMFQLGEWFWFGSLIPYSWEMIEDLDTGTGVQYVKMGKYCILETKFLVCKVKVLLQHTGDLYPFVWGQTGDWKSNSLEDHSDCKAFIRWWRKGQWLGTSKWHRELSLPSDTKLLKFSNITSRYRSFWAASRSCHSSQLNSTATSSSVSNSCNNRVQFNMMGIFFINMEEAWEKLF